MKFAADVRVIALVAPAGPTAREKVEAGVGCLEALGKKVKVMPGVFSSGGELPYLAAPAAVRAADLMAAWLDPEVDLIMAVRGGFGSAHLLPLLDWAAMRRRDLRLVGYSDITALHYAMDRLGVGTPVVAPMAAKLPAALADDYTKKAFCRAFEPYASPRRIKPAAGKLRAIRPGRAVGRPLVGNLAVAATLAGTPYLPSARERIVIFEDLNEPVYKIDRYLTQLYLSGFFTGCAGIAFGLFLDCGDPSELETVLRRAADWTTGPVAANFPFGHAFPMTSLNFKQELTIDVQS